MAEKINLRSSKVKEQKRRVADYGTETPLSSTAVERGSTRWLSGSTVVIEGLLDVTGLTAISGTLNVSGTTTLSGSTTIAGPTGITGALTIAGATSITGKLDVTGPTTLAGALDITGDTTVAGKLDVSGPMATKGALSVEGVTTLKNDLTVTTGGKIKAGNVTIDPSVLSGALTFTNGTRLAQTPNGAQLESVGGGAVTVSPGQADLGIIGGGAVIANAAGVTLIGTQISVTGKLIVTNGARFDGITQGSAGTPANVHIDSQGNLWRANP